MKSSLLGLALISANAFLGETLKQTKMPTPNDLLVGSYEFEIMGAPRRLYLCEHEMSKAIYWAVVNLEPNDWTNEYTEVVGRDYDGAKYDAESGMYTAGVHMFRLFGRRHLDGYYKLIFDSDDGTYVLMERYPELEDGQNQNAEPVWNTYELTKISNVQVANPRMGGRQCLSPNADVEEVPIPSLWKSDLTSNSDRIRDVILVSRNPVNSCWKYEDVYGNTHTYGNVYAPRFEWDGSLLLVRWDNFMNPDKCYVGSMLIVMLDEDLALVSYQCENTVTGRQYLLHMQDMTDETCPFTPSEDAPLTRREHEIHNLDK